MTVAFQAQGPERNDSVGGAEVLQPGNAARITPALSTPPRSFDGDYWAAHAAPDSPSNTAGQESINPKPLSPRPTQRQPAVAVSAWPSNAQPFRLLDLPGTALQSVLEHLPAHDLLATSGVNQQLAKAAEPVFQAACQRSGWKLPRIPRGKAAQCRFPWRSLCSLHACVACSGKGEFPLRESHGARVTTMLALVCQRCVSTERVQQRLVRENLFVDLLGVSGQRLLRTKSRKRRRYADVGI